MPARFIFMNESGNKVDNGFQIFNTNRVGYHIKPFKDRFFIDPSPGIAYSPYHTKMPDGFKQKDTSGQNSRVNQGCISDLIFSNIAVD